MTQALWPYVFGKQLGEQRIVLDNVSDRILRSPILPLVKWIELPDCSVSEDASAEEAIKTLQRSDQRVIFLLGRNRALRGFLTPTPLLATAVGDVPRKALKEVATPRNRLITIEADDSIRSALTLFHKHSFKQLLVLGKDAKQVGVLAQSAVLRWVTEQLLDV